MIIICRFRLLDFGWLRAAGGDTCSGNLVYKALTGSRRELCRLIDGTLFSLAPTAAVSVKFSLLLLFLHSLEIPDLVVDATAEIYPSHAPLGATWPRRSMESQPRIPLSSDFPLCRWMSNMWYRMLHGHRALRTGSYLLS